MLESQYRNHLSDYHREDYENERYTVRYSQIAVMVESVFLFRDYQHYYCLNTLIAIDTGDHGLQARERECFRRDFGPRSDNNCHKTDKEGSGQTRPN